MSIREGILEWSAEPPPGDKSLPVSLPLPGHTASEPRGNMKDLYLKAEAKISNVHWSEAITYVTVGGRDRVNPRGGAGVERGGTNR